MKGAQEVVRQASESRDICIAHVKSLARRSCRKHVGGLKILEARQGCEVNHSTVRLPIPSGTSGHSGMRAACGKPTDEDWICGGLCGRQTGGCGACGEGVYVGSRWKVCRWAGSRRGAGSALIPLHSILFNCLLNSKQPIISSNYSSAQ